MPDEFYTYITKQNDRWDLIAYEYYNNALLYEEIIKANPEIKITPVLEAGIKIKVPVLKEDTTIQFELPPWKQ
jgi:phage tail protein X|uniref:Baseplate wedge protein n=1 Tax=Siphoviridae sp. ctwQT14 TaxID=2827971 RepID=A0A8S5TKK8_9CAUD|nr:MAG TPA: baseplate wedge protein [Siphoviridae sp. ctwQT14]